MLIENEPIDFIKASQMTDETGDVLKATVKTETNVTENTPGGSAVKTEKVKNEELHLKTEEDNSKPEDVVKTEDKKSNDSRFNLDKFKKLEVKANTEDKDEDEKMETEEPEEIEDFNEYSSDEEDGDDGDGDADEDVAEAISENEDGGFDIEFVMPKFISEKSKKEEKKSNEDRNRKSKPDEEINDFFINEGEQYNQSEDEKEENDSSSDEEEEGGGKI